MLRRVPNTPAPSQALKHKLEQQLSARHGAEKVLRCWGSGVFAARYVTAYVSVGGEGAAAASTS
eukprot:321005-Pelagomonas_calceolata.AAC.1